MSIYLTHHLHFTEIQAGWILSSYGMGSMVGVLAGGWLADKYGSFKVQFISQILSGIGWLLLSQVTMYEQLLTCIKKAKEKGADYQRDGFFRRLCQ